MKKNTKKIAIGAASLGLGFSAIAAATYMVTGMFVKIAIERNGMGKFKNSPKTMKIISGIGDNKEFMDYRAASGKKLLSIPMEDIEIEGRDGTRLVGHLYSCENAERIIIAMHGWRSSYNEDFGMLSDFYHENKCSVLYAEQRGQGKSGGEHMGFGLTERFDCLEWVKYICSRFSLPIYLTGISMGAATVLMASNLDMPENVKGIIADCGFTSPNAIWKYIANNNMKMAYGLIGKIANDMCKKKIQTDSIDFSAVEALKSTRIPVLFIHGTDDHFVPIGMTFENYKACASPKKLLVVPGADHAMSFFVDPQQFKKAVLDFWSEFDSYVYPTTEDTQDSNEKSV